MSTIEVIDRLFEILYEEFWEVIYYDSNGNCDWRVEFKSLIYNMNYLQELLYNANKQGWL